MSRVSGECLQMPSVAAQRIVYAIRKPRNNADGAIAPKPGWDGAYAEAPIARAGDPDSTDADMPRMTSMPGAWPLHWLRQHRRGALACAIVASMLAHLIVAVGRSR
jgi:hypothetical protein